MSTLHIYRASAGSGKTFTLTRNYLVHALRDPQHFSRIAALTFTNKATAEMKARIFNTLNKLAEGSEAEHHAFLAEKLGLSSSALQERAHILRRHILAEYKDFTVTTLDKFFQRILRSFAREINVDSGYEPELDYARVLDEIIDRLTEELKPGEPLSEWISEFLLSKLEDGKSRDFKSAIRQLGMKIFDEDFRSIAHELEKTGDTGENINHFKQELFTQKDALESQLGIIAGQALEIIRNNGLSPEDFTGGSRSPFRLFYTWKNGEWKEPTNTFLKLPGTAETWYAKSAKADVKSSIENAYYAGLSDCVNQIIQLFEKYGEHYNSLQAAGENLFVFGIFSALVKKLEEYREENNVLLLADAVDLLRNLTSLDDASFVYEKTGTRYDHYLLDEFQDTSGFQWDCTEPLIHNTLSEGNDNLIVGDPKQSIYRWRGGNRELINSEVPDRFPNHEIHQLDTNYRSRKNIIAFNNTIFSLVPERVFQSVEAEFAGDEHIGERITQLKKTYSDVVQNWSGKKAGGYVKVQFFEKDETVSEEDETPKADEALIETVKSLQDRGFKAKDIVVLVRKNAEAKRAADVLQNEQREHPDSGYIFDVISDEASYLENSSAISLLIHAAKFLLNPLDAVNNCGLLIEWSRIQPLSLQREELFILSRNPVEVRKLLPTAWQEKEATLLRKSTGLFFDDLIHIFGLQHLDEEFSYLAAFRDLLSEFSSGKEPDLNSFIRFWHEKGFSRSIKAPDDIDAIRIMTFHKCKGLEFEAVIIPYFSEQTNHGSGHQVPLWVKSDIEPFNMLPFLPINYGSKLQKTIFAEAYLRERLEAISDGLNLTYVAFTRAKSELHIFTEKPGPSTSDLSKNLGHLLYLIADTKPGIPEGEQYGNIYTEELCLETGEPLQRTETNEETNTGQEKFRLSSYPISSGAEKLRLRAKENPAFYSAERRKGIIIHHLLSKLNTVDDLEHLVNSLSAAGEMADEEKSEALAGLQSLFNEPILARLFSAQAQIKTETALINKQGQQRIPDRIAILEDEVLVCDFKTGKKENEHIRQIREYMELLGSMGYDRVKGILLYTASGETEIFTA